MNPRVGESWYLDHEQTCDPYQGEAVTITSIADDESNMEITFHAHPEYGRKCCTREQLTERIIIDLPKFTSPAEADAWLDANAL